MTCAASKAYLKFNSFIFRFMLHVALLTGSVAVGRDYYEL